MAGRCCRPGLPPPGRPVPGQQEPKEKGTPGGPDVAGEWRGRQGGRAEGSSRLEEEGCELAPAEHGGLSGRYLRTVEVRSLDGQVFPCNQRSWYTQRAVFEVTLNATDDGLVVRELAYDAEPSPCDHGFRRTAQYTAVPHGARMELRWEGGTQTLWHTSDATAEPLAPLVQSPAQPTGAWSWHTRAYDDDGNVRDEWEAWDITRRDDDTLDASYRRRVRTTSRDGSLIACAGAAVWGFEDVYVLDAEREDGLWHFRERAVGAGGSDHPCLRATPQRTLDEAIGEPLGELLVLEWRGKRRQILAR